VPASLRWREQIEICTLNEKHQIEICTFNLFKERAVFARMTFFLVFFAAGLFIRFHLFHNFYYLS